MRIKGLLKRVKDIRKNVIDQFDQISNYVTHQYVFKQNKEAKKQYSGIKEIPFSGIENGLMGKSKDQLKSHGSLGSKSNSENDIETKESKQLAQRKMKESQMNTNEILNWIKEDIRKSKALNQQRNLSMAGRIKRSDIDFVTLNPANSKN